MRLPILFPDEADALDVVSSDDAVEVYTERANFAQVLQALADNGFTPDESNLIQQPDNVLALGPDEATSVLGLIEALEELDDVSNVYHNLELTDEVVAQFA